MYNFYHQIWKIIYMAQSVCKSIHQGPGTGWFPSNTKILASELLKRIGINTSMSNLVRVHVCIVTHTRSRPYYMARKRCTDNPSWEQGVSKTGPTWWFTWIFIKLCIMIGILDMPVYSIPGLRIGSQKS